MFHNPEGTKTKKSTDRPIEMCFPIVKSENICATDIRSMDILSRFSSPVCSREVGIREAALDMMERTVERWMEGYGSPIQCNTLPVNGFISNGTGSARNGSNLSQEYLSLVALHTPALLRLSVSCPFSDVREKCSHILRLVQDRGMPVPFHKTTVGPSSFIPARELPTLGLLDDQTHLLFIDAFLQNNRLDHVTQVMGYHPTYLDIFLRTQNFILRGDGPLPYDYRHFIAIMAAGRHQCSYLINLQKQEFVLQGGDQMWLKGLSHIPQKLRDLYEINKILAHRPWLLNKSHIEKLTKGSDSWSLAEVVHAIVLLAHFHSLASFVFGCGVNEEIDQRTEPPLINKLDNSNDRTVVFSQQRDGWSETDTGVGVDTLMQRMKSLSERTEEFTAEERAKRFERVESQSVELATGTGGIRVEPSIGHFVDDPDFLYEDFARRGEVSDIPTFRVQDYSWDDQGYSLVNRLYNDVGNLLDDKFKTAYNLTYYTMGGRKDVDTSRFRRAIWNYIQCMFGIRHDDYDYGEVNQLLERSLKAFIKSACCFPERVTKADYDHVLREFKHSEKLHMPLYTPTTVALDYMENFNKVHVNLMVLEARMQAELLYALRAVMRYMT